MNHEQTNVCLRLEIKTGMLRIVSSLLCPYTGQGGIQRETGDLGNIYHIMIHENAIFNKALDTEGWLNNSTY